MLTIISDMEIGSIIYLQNDDQLLKFRVEFDHVDIVNAIEKYISNINIYNFKLVNEKEAKTLETPLKFFPSVGKFKLENGIIKTQNYLVPMHYNRELLKLLNSKYKFSEITQKDLKNFSKIKQDCIDFDNKKELNLINDLLLGIKIELLESYKFNENVGNGIIEYIKKLVGEQEAFEVIKKLNTILISCKENNKHVEFLGLKSLFMQASQKKNKVK